MKRPHVASLNEVQITRDGEYAIIAYADSTIATTHLKLGPAVARMSLQEILDRFNDCVRAQERSLAEYEHIAVEIPPGEPQIKYYEPGNQWTPRGDVLRCVIGSGGPGEGPVIYIDDHELSWEEFGRLISSFGGWGARIVFVPDDRTDEEPTIEVREPEEKP